MSSILSRGYDIQRRRDHSVMLQRKEALKMKRLIAERENG